MVYIELVPISMAAYITR